MLLLSYMQTDRSWGPLFFEKVIEDVKGVCDTRFFGANDHHEKDPRTKGKRLGMVCKKTSKETAERNES